MEEKIADLTIMLLYLTAWEEDGYSYDDKNNVVPSKIKRSWKGYSFEILKSLTEKDMLYYSSYKSKSVSLTKTGEKETEKLLKKYFGEDYEN